MPKITFITSDGLEHALEAKCGISAMEAAVQNLIPGIDGDCGGAAACGTCHVYVDPAWIEKTGRAPAGVEGEMLSLTDGATAFSRLACQIEIDEKLDGLVLRLPEGQH